MSFKNREGKAPAYFLNMQHFSHSNPIKRYSTEGKAVSDSAAIQKLEKMLDNTVEWAVLHENNPSKTPIYYYHNKAGITTRLTKEQYKRYLTPSKLYNLWIIPTIEARQQGAVAKRVSGVTNEDIYLHYDRDVLRIDVYFGNNKVGTYKKGVFV